ncbi:hypothetical protein [Synechococcus sp. CBW1107]|uniref:hypothetical protein n=1 Tax=Synechococcus sp. CBW1107 TaxID=2789857 RepID=UPI002AD29535|nr:hypothetical protein [Synechococcus sp. CBW1107]
MRQLLALSACMALLAASPSLAQDSYELFPFTRQRATNVARMYAERLNGGLTVYRPDACMYNRGGGDCLIKGDAKGYIFRFLGGPPGWQILGLAPTAETEIEVSADGRSVVKVIYNGVPRPEQQGPEQSPMPETEPEPDAPAI